MVERKTPTHIAIIMDGNGRWAKQRDMPRSFGHKNGADNLKKILEHAKKRGVKYLTVYAFSTENWSRPKKEIRFLMELFEKYLKAEKENLNELNAKLIFSGSKDGIPKKLLKIMEKIKNHLSENDGIVFNIAFNYGGRKEIIDAINQGLKKGIKEFDEKTVAKNLYNPEVPDPDLVIRTSNEFRISNFLLWEIAYSEFYISEKLWPDFDEIEFDKAVESYKKRERRYGGVK